MSNLNQCHRVFVYGSLMDGFVNHHFLTDMTNLGPRRTANSDYHFWSFSAFPAVTQATENGGYVQGELYLVTNAVLRRLDMLESNGSLYERKLVHLEGEDDPAWMYFFLDGGRPVTELVSRAERVFPDENNCFCWREFWNRKRREAASIW